MGQANELELALDVYNQLVREGCTPNLVTYNILIDVHGKTGQWQEAIKVLDALESQVRLPSPAVHGCVTLFHCATLFMHAHMPLVPNCAVSRLSTAKMAVCSGFSYLLS